MGDCTVGNEQENLLREVEQLRSLIQFDEEQQQLQSSTSDLDPAFSFVTPPDEDSTNSNSNTTFAAPSLVTTANVKSEVFSTCSTSVSVHNARIRDLRRCLDLNLEYQAMVRNYIDAVRQVKQRVELKIYETARTVDIEIELRQQRDNRRPQPVVLRPGVLTLPCFRRFYFRTVYGLCVPPNQDVMAKSRAGEMLASSEHYESGWRWYDENMKDRLFKEVRREALSKLLEPHVQLRDELKQLAEEIDGPALKDIYRDLAETEETIRKIAKETSPEDIYRDQKLIARLDWMRVAKNFGGSVNGNTCRLAWVNYHSPLVNKTPFKRKEDDKLTKWALHFNKRNWLKISEKLKTNRSAFQCIQRYQSKLALKDPNAQKDETPAAMRIEEHDTSVWKKEDDQRLAEAVEHLVGNRPDSLAYIDWHFVSEAVGNFTPPECSARYVHVSEHGKTGRWSLDEHKRLVEAIAIHGPLNWSACSSFVKTRTPLQCFAHYHAKIKKENMEEVIAKRPVVEWTAEEDAIVWWDRKSGDYFRRQYSKIVRKLPGRLRQDVYVRYRQLNKWYMQARWLMRQEGSMLGLVLKSDADITLGNVDAMRKQLSRRQKMRLKEAEKTKEVQQANEISFEEQGQLENLATVLITEASLTRDLARDKVKLMRDIANLKAVPVPLLTNIVHRTDLLSQRSTCYSAIRNKLMDDVSKKEKQQGTDESKKAPTFNHVMARIRNAANNPETADRARQLLAQLESVQASSSVYDLIKISRELDFLATQGKKKSRGDIFGTLANMQQWGSIRNGIYEMTRDCLMPETGIPTRQFYHRLQQTGLAKEAEVLNPAAKLLVSSLGANVESLISEAGNQSQVNMLNDYDKTKSLALKHKIHLSNLETTSDACLRRYLANQALHTLHAPTDNPSTSRGIFPTIQDEFQSATCLTAIEFSDPALRPTLPPNFATSYGYRLLSCSKARLKNLAQESGAGLDGLVKKVIELRSQPTEGYALLKRRFEALFSWPAILSKVEPKTVSKEMVAKVFVKKIEKETPRNFCNLKYMVMSRPNKYEFMDPKKIKMEQTDEQHQPDNGAEEEEQIGLNAILEERNKPKRKDPAKKKNYKDRDKLTGKRKIAQELALTITQRMYEKDIQALEAKKKRIEDRKRARRLERIESTNLGENFNFNNKNNILTDRPVTVEPGQMAKRRKIEISNPLAPIDMFQNMETTIFAEPQYESDEDEDGGENSNFNNRIPAKRPSDSWEEVPASVSESIKTPAEVEAVAVSSNLPAVKVVPLTMQDFLSLFLGIGGNKVQLPFDIPGLTANNNIAQNADRESHVDDDDSASTSTSAQ